MFAKKTTENVEQVVQKMRDYHIELGQKLQQAREARSLSTSDVVDELNIRSIFIQAIEVGDLGALPSGVYRKSYVKTYCEFLGVTLDEEEFDGIVPVQDGANDNHNVLSAESDGAKPGRVALIVSIVLIIAVFAGWNSYNLQQDVERQPLEASQDNEVRSSLEGGIAGFEGPFELSLYAAGDNVVEVLSTEGDILLSRTVAQGELVVLPVDVDAISGGQFPVLLMSERGDALSLYVNGEFIAPLSTLVDYTAEGKYRLELKPSQLLLVSSGNVE